MLFMEVKERNVLEERISVLQTYSPLTPLIHVILFNLSLVLDYGPRPDHVFVKSLQMRFFGDLVLYM